MVTPVLSLLLCAAAWTFVLVLSAVMWRDTNVPELRRFMRLSTLGSAFIVVLALALAAYTASA